MTTTHTLHPDVHENGLDEHCRRCNELARDPLRLLDERVLDDLIQRMVFDRPPRSDNEALAIKNLRDAEEQAEAWYRRVRA